MASCSLKEVRISLPETTRRESKSKSKSKSHPSNSFLELLIAPSRLSLAALGLWENNFQNRCGRFAYACYFLVICLVLAFFTVAQVVVNVMGMTSSAFLSNPVDSYGSVGLCLTVTFQMVITMVFLTWATKFKKFSSLVKVLTRKEFAYVNRTLERKRRLKLEYVAICYLVMACYVLRSLSVFLILTTQFDIDTKIVIFLAYLFDLVIALGMSLAVAFYVCTAAVWNMFNDELAKEIESPSGESTEKVMDRCADTYDALTNFTGQVAGTFRFYNTVHVATVLQLIAETYETMYLEDRQILHLVDWLAALTSLSALWAAAFVHFAACGTANQLYMLYRTRTKDPENTPSREACRKFEAFYQHVANEWAPTRLDILGIVPITFAVIAMFIFTAANWIAVLMQFRQGAQGWSAGSSGYNCTGMSTGIAVGNGSFNESLRNVTS